MFLGLAIGACEDIIHVIPSPSRGLDECQQCVLSRSSPAPRNRERHPPPLGGSCSISLGSTADIAFLVAYRNAMQSSNCNLIHFIGNRMFAISSQAVNASSYDKMSSNFLSRAKKLVNIAFAIANMHTAIGLAKKRAGLAQILRPSNAFFALYGHSRRIGLVQRMAAHKFVARLKFDRGKSQGQSFRRHRKAGMHQNTANGTGLRISINPFTLLANRLQLARKTNQFGLFSLIGKFRRILQHQHRTRATRSGGC